MEQNKLTMVADYWSEVDCDASDRNFYCFPPIRARSCKLIFGEYDASRRNWCEYWTVEKYLKDKIPFDKCLSICCGTGPIERTLSRLNLAKKIVGTDIAPGAIEKAKQRAKDENLHNIEYYVADMNNERFTEEEYDIIWANGALHHIRDLDRVIKTLYSSLKPGGYLISNEYVGPKYQQIPERQQEIINAVRHLIPLELRPELEKYQYDIYGKAWEMKPIEYYLKTDPSECVNSNNIIPILKTNFDEVEVKYFDGSIIMHALGSKFYNNFDLNNQKHRKLLEMLFGIEDSLIEAGEIPRDNAHIICRKKAATFAVPKRNMEQCAFNYDMNHRAGFLKTPLVLLYHRVADDPIDSQLLAVSPENFEAHLRELAENYRVLPLHQLLGEICRNELKPDTVALTFDDGYSDNLTNAVPLLEKHGLHATIFVTSGMLGSDREFWWDELERIFLTGTPLPDVLAISNPQGTLTWDLASPRNRLKAYDELCVMLRVNPVAQTEAIVDRLLDWSGLAPPGRTTHRILSCEQLRQLTASPAIEIGSHTLSHTRLSALSPAQQRREIQGSRQQLEALIKEPVRMFSYPYGTSGDFTRQTAQIVAEEGYDAGIANIQRNITAPLDMYAVPRRLVRNWPEKAFASWLKNEDKSRLEHETISARADRLINYLLSPWSKEKQTVQPQNK